MAMNKNLSMLLTGFILIIIGLTLFGATSQSVYDATHLSTTSNETIAIASQTGTTAQDDVLSLQYFGNATINTDDTDVTIGTDVNFTKAGTITTIANFTDANYDISYTYEGEEYVTDGTSRTMINLINIFFALGILGIGFLIAKNALEEMGML